MGSYYLYCPNCGEDAGGNDWHLGEPDGHTAEEDAQARLHEHLADCPGSFRSGAAVAFGLMGMAEAIRTNYDRLRACVLHSPPYCGGPCMRCGYDDGWRRKEPEWHLEDDERAF